MSYFQIVARVTTFSKIDQEGNPHWEEGFVSGFPPPKQKLSFLLETSSTITQEDLTYITLTKLLTPRYTNIIRILYLSFDKIDLATVTPLAKLFGALPSAKAYVQFIVKHKGKLYVVKEQLAFQVIEREKIEICKMMKLLTHESKVVRDFAKDYLERA